MNEKRKEHWEKVYQSKSDDQTSWFQPSPKLSFALIEATGAGTEANFIDIGGGTSRLIDTLIEQGYQKLSVLDISTTALERSQRRLGEQAKLVHWLVSDATHFTLEQPVEIWHDRAVFHFLTDSNDRQAYLNQLNRYLNIGGHLIIAAFSPDGPKQCSGLDIVQYDTESLQETLGDGYQLIENTSELHTTPTGGEQHFNYFHFLKIN